MQCFVLIAKKIVLFCVSFMCYNCFAVDSQKIDFSTSSTQVTLSKDFSFGGIELKLSNYKSNQNNMSSRLSPEISLYSSFSSSNKFNLVLLNDSELNLSKSKFNRYKNTIPAVYKVTLKGYSIMEYSNYKTDTWSLNKADLKAFRQPEIMFSISKQF